MNIYYECSWKKTNVQNLYASLSIFMLPALVCIDMSLLNDCHTVPRYFLWGMYYDMNPVSMII